MLGLGEIFRAVGELLGIIRKKQELNNTPEMIAAAKAQKEAARNDKISTDTQTGNDEKTRINISP